MFKKMAGMYQSKRREKERKPSRGGGGEDIIAKITKKACVKYLFFIYLIYYPRGRIMGYIDIDFIYFILLLYYKMYLCIQ